MVDVYVGAGTELRSLHGKAAIAMLAQAPGLLWTDAEVAVWSTRADANWDLGETNDSDLWAEVVSRKNDFLAAPTADLYPGPALTGGEVVQSGAETGEEPSISEREAAIDCMCAAFYALVKPGAEDAQDCIDGVVSRVMAQINTTTYPSLNADYDGPWQREGANRVNDGAPTFIVARFWINLLAAIDYVGLDAFTSGQQETIAEFFYWWAELGAYSLHRAISANIPGRLTGDYEWTGGLNYDWTPFTSGPTATNPVRWMNNRRALMNTMSAFATEIIDRIGWDTPASYMTVAELRARAHHHVKESIVNGVYTESADPSASGKAGFAYDFDRGSLAIWYSMASLSAHIMVADLAARRGDSSLYDYTTRDGTPDGTGSQKGSVCRTGDPDKSLLLAARYLSRHYAGIYTKSNSAGSINGTTRVHDAAALPVLNLYYGDAEIQDNYLPSVDRTAYPASPGTSGGMRGWFFGWALLPDGPFLAHEIGVDPYP